MPFARGNIAEKYKGTLATAKSARVLLRLDSDNNLETEVGSMFLGVAAVGKILISFSRRECAVQISVQPRRCSSAAHTW